MTEVSTSFHTQAINAMYFPSIPPKAPKSAIAYTRAVSEAPHTALTGVVVDGRIPERHPVSPRCRVRNIVGYTNRWRLPESLGSDLLGSSQAIKAVNASYSPAIVRIITGEHPKFSTNLDVSKSYSFHLKHDRPSTQPEFSSQDRIPELSYRSKSTLGPVKRYTPKTARTSTPNDLFLYHSKKSKTFIGPDVLLKCLDMEWELHQPFIKKAGVLSQLLRAADDPTPHKYYRSPASETLDTYIKKSNFYSNEYQEISSRLSMVEKKDGSDTEDEIKRVEHPSHVSEKRVSSVTVISLNVTDPLVTKKSMAIALGNLYLDEPDVDLEEVSGVLAAASTIGYKDLVEGCTRIMLNTLSSKTVCKYYKAVSQYQQEELVAACERWLELNLIPQVSSEIYLREVPMDLLQKIIKSNRLFTTNEYHVYRTLAYWLFLQINPHVQLFPSHSTVLSFYNSLPKSSAYLERDDGQVYAPLFSAVRLHGIIDTTNIQDMQIMNILPQSWLINLLTQHYHSLQGGGDMSALKSFTNAAVRQGFIIDDEPHYHSEVMSLHGFHFELKANRQSTDGTYAFYMQRLKPGDPILSFRQCERHTFSMRPDRDVRYSITIQYFDKGELQTYTTGVLTQKFGFGDKISKSEVIKLENLKKPIYVTYAVLFPAS